MSFFNYKSIIKEDYEVRIKVETRLFQEAVERAAVIILEKQNDPVIINLAKDSLWLCCTNEYGEVRADVPVESWGQNIRIGFNPLLLVETLKAIEDREIYIDFASALGPCTIRPVETSDFIYVIGAVRLPQG